MLEVELTKTGKISDLSAHQRQFGQIRKPTLPESLYLAYFVETQVQSKQQRCIQILQGLYRSDIIIASNIGLNTQMQKGEAGKPDMYNIFDDIFVVIMIYLSYDIRR